jgi:hypothetical protein
LALEPGGGALGSGVELAAAAGVNHRNGTQDYFHLASMPLRGQPRLT